MDKVIEALKKECVYSAYVEMAEQQLHGRGEWLLSEDEHDTVIENAEDVYHGNTDHLLIEVDMGWDEEKNEERKPRRFKVTFTAHVEEVL